MSLLKVSSYDKLYIFIKIRIIFYILSALTLSLEREEIIIT